jgi:cytochrome b561
MSVGLAVFLLVGVRLIWRFIDPPPPAEKTPFGRFGDLASAGMHWLLYVLILAIVLFGVAAQFADGGAIPFFGIFQIVSPWIKDHGLAENLEDVHETLAHGFMIVAGLHAAAALVHHFLLRDRTLTRMLPA